MGNKLGKRRQVVDEKYTRPQGLYEIKDVDFKKLRKLILDSKLAPCYPGGDECDCDLLEECPICYLYYPTLNRSKCCMKSICTECFLQVKNPYSPRPTQCPFCKTSNYAVEYKGGKSKEERGMEQLEEQKVIEAKIRMRQQEMEEEKERHHSKEETGRLNTELRSKDTSCSTSRGIECEEASTSQESSGGQVLRQAQYTRHGRDDEFDLDLEDIMVMEAIWLSIQENEKAGNLHHDEATMPELYTIADTYMSPVVAPMAASSSSSSSPSGGLACAIAALAERQLIGESSASYNGLISPLDMLPSTSTSSSSSRNSKRVKKTRRRLTDSSSPMEVDPSSEVTEVGTSNMKPDDSEGEAEILSAPPPPPPLMHHPRRNPKRSKSIKKRCSREIHETSVPPPPAQSPISSFHDDYSGGICSEGVEDHSEFILTPPLPPYVIGSGYQSSFPSPIVAENFEEPMMLAMAASLAEVQARTTAQGVAWH